MTKIVPTMDQLNEVQQVENTVGTFNLPIDLDLDLRQSDGGIGTVYSTTDPNIDLSVANVAYVQSQIASDTVVAWMPGSTYATGALVRDPDDISRIFISRIDNNQGNPLPVAPALDNTQWFHINAVGVNLSDIRDFARTDRDTLVPDERIVSTIARTSQIPAPYDADDNATGFLQANDLMVSGNTITFPDGSTYVISVNAAGNLVLPDGSIFASISMAQLQTEIQNRIAGDNALDTRIDTLTTNLNNEVARATGAENTLTTNLTNLNTRVNDLGITLAYDDTADRITATVNGMSSSIVIDDIGTVVVANQAGATTELTSITIDGVNYFLPPSGTVVVANPTSSDTDPTLHALSVGGTTYRIEGGGAGGSNVIPNPTGNDAVPNNAPLLDTVRVNGDPFRIGGSGSDVREPMEIIRSAIFDGNTNRTLVRDTDRTPLGFDFALANGNNIQMRYNRVEGRVTAEIFTGPWIGTVTGSAGQQLRHSFVFDSDNNFINDPWLFELVQLLNTDITDNGDIVEFGTHFIITDNGDLLSFADGVTLTDNGDIVVWQ